MGSTAPSVTGFRNLLPCQAGGQRAGLRLTVTHYAGGDQGRVVHPRRRRRGPGVAQLAALMDGAGGFGGHMAGDAAGEGEPLEELLHAVLVLRDVGVDLGVAAVQPVLRHHGVAAVAGAGEVDHVQIIPLDDPVQMGVDEVLPGQVPQWPTMVCFRSAAVRGRSSRGLSSR